MPTSADDILKLVTDRNPNCAKVGVFDIDGVFRGKYMAIDKLRSALEKGFGFCDVVLGWDSNDQLLDNLSFTGWHTAYPDAEARLLPETMRTLPFEGGMPLVLGEFSGRAEAVCPRGVLRRVLDRAAAQGWAVKAACEFEFFVFEETPQSIRDKGYRHLKPITPGNFGYSMLRSGVHSISTRSCGRPARRCGSSLRGCTPRPAPACWRLRSGWTMRSRRRTRRRCSRRSSRSSASGVAGWRPSWPNGRATGRANRDTSFIAAGFEIRRLDLLRSRRQAPYVGADALVCRRPAGADAGAAGDGLPTVNSYTRLIPGFWAPTAATWGYENRTCALRVIGGSASSQRVEYRIAAADINPYIALAAAIGSGLWGIENRIEPDAPIAGNAYEQESPERALPSTLWDAAQRLRASEAARELFGAEFVDHYAATREWEEREARKAVTDWQLARYFEII
jgi:glutamine synthetase